VSTYSKPKRIGLEFTGNFTLEVSVKLRVTVNSSTTGQDEKVFFHRYSSFYFFLSSGCGVDFHSGKRPYDYPPAKWMSKEPEMWFGSNYNFDGYGFDGCLILGSQSIDIQVFFNKGNGVSFIKKGKDEPGTRGWCKFGPDKLVVRIDKERDAYFNGLLDDALQGDYARAVVGIASIAIGAYVNNGMKAGLKNVANAGLKISMGKNSLYYSIGRRGAMNTWVALEAKMRADLASSVYGR
jgi:hypothetical protein